MRTAKLNLLSTVGGPHAEALEKPWLVNRLRDGAGQLLLGAGIEKLTVDAVLDHSRHAGDAGGDDGHLHGHRLEHHVGQTLAEAAQDEHVHRLVTVAEVGAEAHQADTVAGVQLIDLSLQGMLLIALAEDGKAQVGPR